MARGDEGGGISRRKLLIGGGASVGLVVAWALWPRDYRPNLRAGEGETLFNAFLKIGRDGRVIVAVPQAERGRGSIPRCRRSSPTSWAPTGGRWRSSPRLCRRFMPMCFSPRKRRPQFLPGAFGIDRWRRGNMRCATR